MPVLFRRLFISHILISFVVMVSQGTIIHVLTEVYWKIIHKGLVLYKISDSLVLISLLLDVRGSVHHSKFAKKIQKDATAYQFFFSYLCEAQHVSGDTPPIIRSLKLHYQPLVLDTWRVVGRVVAGRCQVEYEKVQRRFK